MQAMSDTYKLIRVRWLFLKNNFVHPAPDKWGRWGLIGILGGLFFVANYAFFYRMIRYLDELPFKVGEELIFQLLNVIFLTLFVMVLFSAIIASLSIYYISSDLDFLHSQPISKGSIIRVRFIQTLINASWVVLIFAFPIFLAYGYYFNVNFGYYFYLLASLPPFVVIPTLLGRSWDYFISRAWWHFSDFCRRKSFLIKKFPTNRSSPLLKASKCRNSDSTPAVG